MPFDRPRSTEPLTSPATRAIAHLVVLADTIENRSEMRARITSAWPHREQVAMCWNPCGQYPSLIVACDPVADDDGECYRLVGDARAGGRMELDEVMASADRPEEAADLLIELLRAQVRL